MSLLIPQWLLLLPMFGIIVGYTQAESCDLPAYLQSKVWESHVKRSRIDTMKYVQFMENEMLTTDFSYEDPVTDSKMCVRHISDGKYLFQSSHGLSQSYTCVQFLKRGSNVVQLRASTRAGGNDSSLCDEANMALDPWLLVHPDAYEEDKCSLVGGYNVRIWDNAQQLELCEDSAIKPRLESECQEGEGMTLDFRSPDCQPPRNHMSIVQKLSCLGGWQDGAYKFMVVTDSSDLMAKVWLVRYHQLSNGNLEAYLMSDINTNLDASMQANPRYFKLTMSLQMFPSLCEDEGGESCDEAHCSGDIAEFCRKTCNLCQDVVVGECQFPGSYRGEWTESSFQGERDVRITTSMLYHEEMANFECQNLYVEQLYEGLTRHTVANIFRNGCKPRYKCVEMSHRTPSVMSYRLGQSLPWPLDIYDLGPEGICHNGFFTLTPDSPDVSFLSERSPKNLILKPKRGYRRPSVDCNFPGLFEVVAHSPTGDKCNGTLSTQCANDDTMTLTMQEGCGQPEQKFRCLASWSEHLKYFLITEVPTRPNELACWIYDVDIYDTYENKMYLVKAADCNALVPLNIEFRGATNYVGKFEFRPVEVTLPDCEKPHYSTTPETPATRWSHITHRPFSSNTTIRATPTKPPRSSPLPYSKAANDMTSSAQSFQPPDVTTDPRWYNDARNHEVTQKDDIFKWTSSSRSVSAGWTVVPLALVAVLLYVP